MKADFEKKIRENRDYFDSSQPDDGHIERFIGRLKEADKAKRKKFYFIVFSRVAALVLLLLAITFVTYTILNNSNSVYSAQITVISFSDEIKEALAYYDASSKILLDSIYRSAPDSIEGNKIKNLVEEQFRVLDANSAKIEKEYQKNPQNIELSAALINNKRKKVEVAEQIVKQLDLSNKGFF